MAQQFLPTLEVLMGTEKKKRPGYQDEMKIFICGARNAGKAAFVTRAVDKCFDTGFDPFGEINHRSMVSTPSYKNRIVELMDMGAEDQMRIFIRQYTPTMDALLLFYDVSSRESFESLSELYAYFQTMPEWEARKKEVVVPVKVVAGKIDIAKKEWAVSEEEGKGFASKIGCGFATCSAKEGVGVIELVEEMVDVVAGAKEKKELEEKAERERKELEEKREQERLEKIANSRWRGVLEKVKVRFHIGQG